ncbi:MAG: hypothetical protein WC277_08450 [Bacilli bacterium]|jgi:hypothetical protein
MVTKQEIRNYYIEKTWDNFRGLSGYVPPAVERTLSHYKEDERGIYSPETNLIVVDMPREYPTMEEFLEGLREEIAETIKGLQWVASL